jgi:hypothetical protein
MKKNIDLTKSITREPLKVEDMDIPFYLDKDVRIAILKKSQELKVDPRLLVHVF